MPLATKFNDTVAMDLKMWKQGIYFLALVDHYTRYCTASVIYNKLPSTVIEASFTHWIVMFGAPLQFLSDNGCDFNNAQMRVLADKFNIKLLCTAAESP